MIKRLKVKEYMSGKELAELLHRSRLRWNNGAVIQREATARGGYSYCMIGQIARHAGVSNEVLVGYSAEAPASIPTLNDAAATKAECVRNFCNYPDLIEVKGWVDRLLAIEVDRQRLRKGKL